MRHGGTEVAPMSTTSELDVAVRVAKPATPSELVKLGDTQLGTFVTRDL